MKHLANKVKEQPVLVLLFLLTTVGAVLPNSTLTPGVVTALSAEEVCARRWGTDRRHVSERMKRQVSAAYGVPWTDRGHWEIDHLVPRELGGADAAGNLWMQCCRKNGVAVGDAKVKDQLENRLHRLVCAGSVSLPMAQDAMRSNWIEASERY